MIQLRMLLSCWEGEIRKTAIIFSLYLFPAPSVFPKNLRHILNQGLSTLSLFKFSLITTLCYVVASALTAQQEGTTNSRERFWIHIIAVLYEKRKCQHLAVIAWPDWTISSIVRNGARNPLSLGKWAGLNSLFFHRFARPLSSVCCVILLWIWIVYLI